PCIFLPLRQQSSQSHNIVSCGRQSKDPGDFLLPAMPQFSHQPDIFHPAKALFYPLALYLTDPVACGTGGSAINLTVLLFCRYMRRNVQRSTLINKVSRVITFIRTHCSARTFALKGQHGYPCIPFLACSCRSHFCFY